MLRRLQAAALVSAVALAASLVEPAPAEAQNFRVSIGFPAYGYPAYGYGYPYYGNGYGNVYFMSWAEAHQKYIYSLPTYAPVSITPWGRIVPR